jgi:serine/threonine-protein kinase
VTVAMMHIRDAPPPLPPDVPPYARAVVEATLVKDPTHRYGNGGEFAAAVAAVRAGHPLPAPVNRVTSPQYGTSGASNPRMLPVGPPSSPHQVPGTGGFPMGPPRPPRRSRAGLWALLIVLGVVLLVLAVLGVASLLDADRDTDGTSTPETTGSAEAPAGNADEDDGTDSGSDSGTDTEQPGNPPMTGIPTREPGKPVQVEESVFIGKPATFAMETLEQAGLRPKAANQYGREPNDMERCVVVAVGPEGRRPAGSGVVVSCEEEEEPPR